ncbi:lytic transglycosylase domain-containing protein [Nitritalea halalkaliphila]|nr:lytic transglycosylase domain-containing protein [Nitritalea halalkaliphila]
MKRCMSFLLLTLLTGILWSSPDSLSARTIGPSPALRSVLNRPVPQVPARMQVANMQLELDAQARREIQADVDALYRNENYLQIKLRRIRTYLPLVEAELRAAGMPDDLKYLVIQESSLIADAVSSSNAVGYWQFKQGTAEEVFLRVDRQIDERKNIVSSTQGAARYLGKNMATFDNWMVAIVAYQMGPGGAKNYFGSQFSGQRKLQIDRKTHWYFKKFLAHKVAFEGYQDGFVSQTESLQAVPLQGPTTLKSLAAEWSVPLERLEAYNKWTRDGHIPGDKTYTVIVPGASDIRPPVLAERRPQAVPSPSDPSLLAGNVPSASAILTSAPELYRSRRPAKAPWQHSWACEKVNSAA